MKRILLLFCVLPLAACQNFDLKTRDDVRGEGGGPAPASTSDNQNGGAKPVEVKTPPPDKADEVDTQMRQLTGRVDEVENQVNQSNANFQSVSKDNQTRDQKIAALEDSVKKLQADVQALTEQMTKKAAPTDPNGLITDADGLASAKKYKEAIVEYQKYRDTYPKGNRYAEATYKIGTCFQELGMKDEARAFYEEVVNKHPKAPEAKKAAKRLKALK